MKAGTCTVGENLETMESVCEETKKAAEKMQAEGKKLDKDAGKEALKGMVPGIKSIAKWPVIKDRVTAYKDQVGVTGMLRAPKAIKGLVKALPKLPGAVKTQVSAVNTATKFLKYSGVDTSEADNLTADI